MSKSTQALGKSGTANEAQERILLSTLSEDHPLSVQFRGRRKKKCPFLTTTEQKTVIVITVILIINGYSNNSFPVTKRI